MKVGSEIENQKIAEIIDEAGLEDVKKQLLIEKIFYYEFTKFSELVEIMPFSKGTVSKYLNQLKDNNIVDKKVTDDRSVDWQVTDKGKLYLMYRDWLNDNEEYDVRELIELKEEVNEYIERKALKQAIGVKDLQQAYEDLYFLEDKNKLSEPLAHFLQIFAEVDIEDYEFHLVKRNKD